MAPISWRLIIYYFFLLGLYNIWIVSGLRNNVVSHCSRLNKGVEGKARNLLYATKFLILNVELIPQSLGMPMAYPFSTTLDYISNGPVLLAIS